MTGSKLASAKSMLEQLIILSLSVVFIIKMITRWEGLTLLLGGLVFIAIALLVTRLRGMTLWLIVLFMSIGALLLIVQEAQLRYWFEAASLNVTLVTLFIFAPLFGIPVKLPEYIEALNRFYDSKLRSRSVLFTGAQLLTQIMGVFLNVGSISVAYHVIFSKPRPSMSLLLANALNRGFAGAIFWSPYFAAMAVVLSSLSVSWSSLLPYLLGLSLLSFIVSLAVDYKGLKHAESIPAEERTEEPAEPNMAEANGAASFPVGLAVYLSSAITVILLLERFVDLPMILITCMGAVIFPLIWCAAKGALPTYRQGLRHHASVTLPALKKEIALFLAAGFFSGAIGMIGFGAAVPRALELVPLPVSVSFAALTIILITVTSMAGLHPIVLVTILASGIEPAAVHISPSCFAVLLLGSWGLSNTVSPVSAVNNLLAALYKKTPYELARPNYPFAACMAAVLLMYVLAVGV